MGSDLVELFRALHKSRTMVLVQPSDILPMTKTLIERALLSKIHQDENGVEAESLNDDIWQLARFQQLGSDETSFVNFVENNPTHGPTSVGPAELIEIDRLERVWGPIIENERTQRCSRFGTRSQGGQV